MQFLVYALVFVALLWPSRAAPARDQDGRVALRASSPTPDLAAVAALTSRFRRAAYFSRAAYCSTSSLVNLTCGPACDALGDDVRFLLSGGDSGATPDYFVAYDPSSSTIVVAHQGTDPDNVLSIVNDVHLCLEPINTNLVPAARSNKYIQVHSGFQIAFEKTAIEILATVQKALITTGANNVLLTGHSLGAAIATLEAVMFKSQLNPSITVTAALFGSPRVGNQAFADFVDEHLGNRVWRMTNQADPVPLLPPRVLGYVHTSGEVHINRVDRNGNAVDVVECQGQESAMCSDSENLLFCDIQDHLGPYFENILFGSDQCSY